VSDTGRDDAEQHKFCAGVSSNIQGDKTIYRNLLYLILGDDGFEYYVDTMYAREKTKFKSLGVTAMLAEYEKCRVDINTYCDTTKCEGDRAAQKLAKANAGENDCITVFDLEFRALYQFKETFASKVIIDRESYDQCLANDNIIVVLLDTVFDSFISVLKKFKFNVLKIKFFFTRSDLHKQLILIYTILAIVAVMNKKIMNLAFGIAYLMILNTLEVNKTLSLLGSVATILVSLRFSKEFAAITLWIYNPN
jgi:hypothetical protein